MSTHKSFTKIWLLAVLLITFVAGCGGNDSATPSSQKTITGYSLNGVSGTINEPAKTIAVTMPFGSPVTALVATFATTGASLKVDAATQTSGITANNFSSPVVYTVTAADGTTATYTVTVTVVGISAKAITAISFAGISGAEGIINEAAKTVAVTVPSGTDVTALKMTFASAAKSVKIGEVSQVSGVTANNFTSPVSYTVTAADDTTTTYTVTVILAANSAKAITAFSFAGFTGAAGIINEAAKTITVTVPSGTNVTALVASFAATGTGVKVGSTVQTSTVTPNNFSRPVVYTVTAADSTTTTYAVTVTVAGSSAKAITAYSFAGFSGATGIIDEAAKTIAVTVPNGTNVSALVATFATTGTIAKVQTVVQTSGATANNFTNPLTYTITAADATTAQYVVTVTVATAKGPAVVNLGTAGNFVILAKSGISTTGTSAVTGNIGVSPAAATFITGFNLIADSTNTFSTSSLVTGAIYAANYASPTPANMTTAISDMETAFTDAAGRTLPDFNELYAGDITGKTLVPGLYKWSTGVLLSSGGVTLTGGPNDVWIFQVAQDLTVGNSAIVTLSGGAQAKNIFWQVSGKATLGTAVNFKGILMSQTLVSLNTGTTVNGRVLAQTEITLDATAVTAP